MMGTLLHKMVRMKPLESVTPDTSLRRCLGVCDLTVMGIGSMVGSGIYIMTGIATRDQAGPGIIVSFFVAAIVILLVMGSYTELAASLHRTGSSYLYVYLTLGELPAFMNGFTSLLLIILGGATNGRAWSAYLDSVFDDVISNYTINHIGTWDVGKPIAQYPDFMAAGIVVLITLVVAAGAKCSTRVMGIFTALNVVILIFISITGFIFADFSNWTNPATGGFFPFGWHGLIHGSATCFWAFSGFEAISMTVEEARNSRRDIPLSSILTLIIVTLLYISTAAAVTLVTSYQNLDHEAPLPSAFASRGLNWARYVVAVGPVCGLTTTMLSSLYAFGRMAYAISDDGLFFHIFARVEPCSQVPLFSILFSGLSMALVALFLDLEDIITFSVNLVIISYILVPICVIILRYRVLSVPVPVSLMNTDPKDDEDASENGIVLRPQVGNEPGVLKARYRRLGWILGNKPGRWPKLALLMLVACMMLLAALVSEGGPHLEAGQWWAVLLFVWLLLLIIGLMLTMGAHGQTKSEEEFRIPCVPFIPSLSILSCLLLLFVNSSVSGWIGTIAMLVIAVFIYFIYGIHHSKLNATVPSTVRLRDLSSETLDEARVGLLAAEDDE